MYFLQHKIMSIPPVIINKLINNFNFINFQCFIIFNFILVEGIKLYFIYKIKNIVKYIVGIFI